MVLSTVATTSTEAQASAVTVGECAGQAIVQMAREVHNNVDYAIKFFIAALAFNSEREM